MYPDASVFICENKEVAEFFEKAAKGHDGKKVANWLMGDFFAMLNRKNLTIENSPISAENLGKLVELIETIAGSVAGEKAGEIASLVVVWLAFVLLLYLGIKMLVESIKEMKKPIEEKHERKFSIKEVLFYGFATAVDALAAGVVLHAGLSTTSTVWLHVSIILCLTFTISLIGLFLGKQIMRFLKGKYEIAGIIGGIILILLAVWVVVSHYAGL